MDLSMKVALIKESVNAMQDLQVPRVMSVQRITMDIQLVQVKCQFIHQGFQFIVMIVILIYHRM